MSIFEIGVCIFIVILIIQVHYLTKQLKKLEEERIKINTDLAKLALYQLEQYKLNEQVIKKIQEIDERDLYRNIDFLKQNGKLGEA